MNERLDDRSSDSALELVGLNYSYRHQWTGRRIPVLHDINLKVDRGESFGFLGHNGAGKTTTIKCILGLVRLTSGEIRIAGRSHTEDESRASVGYLPEQPYFYDHLTVREILEMYAHLSRVPEKEVRVRIDWALELVGVKDRHRSPMRSLSKGLTQRVALAQAVISKPGLLILDEPFSGLDPIGRKEFRDIFFNLKKDGTTIFMCSHILSDVEFLCDRVSIMTRGSIKGVFDLKTAPEFTGGSYELVLRDTGSDALQEFMAEFPNGEAQRKFVRFNFPRREVADTALKSAVEKGLTVDSFHFASMSLEDLFVQLVKRDGGNPQAQTGDSR